MTGTCQPARGIATEGTDADVGNGKVAGAWAQMPVLNLSKLPFKLPLSSVPGMGMLIIVMLNASGACRGT